MTWREGDRTVSVFSEISRWNIIPAVATVESCPKVVQTPSLPWSIVSTTAFAEIKHFAVLYSPQMWPEFTFCCRTALGSHTDTHVLWNNAWCRATSLTTHVCSSSLFFLFHHMWQFCSLRQIKAFVSRICKVNKSMSIFSICLDLWARYNSQFCRYERGETIRDHLCRESSEIKTSRFRRRKSLAMHDLLPNPKNALSRIADWISHGREGTRTCFHSECQFCNTGTKWNGI